MHIIARMNVGGPAVEIVELMRGLDPLVISQRVVTGYCHDTERDYLDTQAPDVDVLRIRELGRNSGPFHSVVALCKLVALIRELRPDIVHTHTAKAGVVGRIAAKISGTKCKVVHTHHGHLLQGYFNSFVTGVVHSIERALARITDTMIVVGARVRDDLLDVGVGKVNQYRVIHTGVQEIPLPDSSGARQDLGLRPDSVVVAFVGRLVAVKRPDRMLRVIELVTASNPNVDFVIAGGGDQFDYVSRYIANRRLPARTLEWVDDLGPVFASADLIMLTSDNEGLPVVVLEAALASVPCVSTDVGAVRDFIQNGVSGMLVEPEADAVANAILHLTRFPDHIVAMGDAALKRARTSFKIEDFLEGHSRTYLET